VQTFSQNRTETVGLEQSRSAVLNSLTSLSSRRSYDHTIREFIEWYCSEPRLALNKTVVTRYRTSLEQATLCFINHQLATRCRPQACIRGLGFGPAESRPCGRNPAREGRKETRRTDRKLSDDRAGEAIARSVRPLQPPRQARLRYDSRIARLRAPAGRACWACGRGSGAEGRTLGDRRSQRKRGATSEQSPFLLG
jgi:hypothetical protein